MQVEGLDRPFFVVGENVHCTRILLKRGKRVGQSPDGGAAILWSDADGRERHLAIPEKFQAASDYLEGRVKHVQIATHVALEGGADARTALDYLRHVVQRQVDAGVDYLDVNTDEFGLKPEQQAAGMRFLVETVQSITTTPLAIDSSRLETIAEGLAKYNADSGRPLLNSASLERIDALDLAIQHDCPVIVTAAGEKGMPSSSAERIDHATRMVDAAIAKGIALADIHVDLLVFPISVDVTFGRNYLDAVAAIRQRYGTDLHITGGMSNISFGVPVRRLVNDVFVNLAIEHGADGGIIDPVARPLQGVVTLDHTSRPCALARAMLLGEDDQCKQFLSAYREGELGVEPPRRRRRSTSPQ